MLEAVSAQERAGCDIVVSLGMGAEPPPAITASRLHCISAYPADLAQTNLAALRDNYEIDGLSDHSHQTDMGALAVAAGASIIETHVRLDDTDPANPDYAVSFTPAEFAEYVRLVRRAETIMGDGVRRVQSCEEQNLRFRVTG